VRIIGIDPGTSCGYAYTDSGEVEVHQSGVWNLKPGRHEGAGMRWLRLVRYLEELVNPDKVGTAALFYEEVRRHRSTYAGHVYGGVIATIQTVCEEYKVPYQGSGVGACKRRATGKGNSPKAAMIQAAHEQFGMPPLLGDDQADALWILQCGLDELGYFKGSNWR